MDSLTQIALGAAVSVAVMRRRTATWKAALWGAVAGTLPDLDVLIDHGDPILDMVLHRAETHALFWLTLFSVPFSAGVIAIHREWGQWRRWWLALWLAFVTHPLLDALTVYGTRIGLPFSSEPVGTASIFIIDPLVTLPWLAGTAVALALRGSSAGLRANGIGLALGCAVLVFGFAAQQQVRGIARAALQQQGIPSDRLLVVPAAFSTLLWRVVAVTDDAYFEGYRSLFDSGPGLRFDRFERGAGLDRELAAHPGLAQIRHFSRGYYRLREEGGQVRVADLRMGAEPTYVFDFVIAERRSALAPLPVARAAGGRPDLSRTLPWFWRRMWGEPLPPPR